MSTTGSRGQDHDRADGSTTRGLCYHAKPVRVTATILQAHGWRLRAAIPAL